MLRRISRLIFIRFSWIKSALKPNSFDVNVYKTFNFDLRHFDYDQLKTHYYAHSNRELRMAKFIDFIKLFPRILDFDRIKLNNVMYPDSNYRNFNQIAVHLNQLHSKRVIYVTHLNIKLMSIILNALGANTESESELDIENEWISIDIFTDMLVAAIEKNKDIFDQLFVDFNLRPLETIYELTLKIFNTNLGIHSMRKIVLAHFENKSVESMRMLLRTLFANCFRRPDLLAFRQWSDFSKYDLYNNFKNEFPDSAIFKHQFFEELNSDDNILECCCDEYHHTLETNRRGISFILSVYNGEEFIQEFFNNILSLFHFNECELIIVDANSSDNTEAVCKMYAKNYRNISYFKSQKKITIYEAWNIAIKMAKFDLVCNANVDDRKVKNFICQISQESSRNEKPTVYYSDFIEHSQLDKKIVRVPFVNKYSIFEFNSPHASPVWDKKIHEMHGFFDENLISIADWVFWTKLVWNEVKFIKISQPLYTYYNNPQGVSSKFNSAGLLEQWTFFSAYSREIIKICREIDMKLSDKHGSIEF